MLSACSLVFFAEEVQPMVQQMISDPFAAQPPLHILVVDDRVDVATSLVLLLKRYGHMTEEANNGRQALDAGPGLLPDVIFLDIGLPDRSGYDVCKEMRQTDWGSHAFIVALTGRDDPADVIRTANAGFDLHVAKPMGFETLQTILRTVKTRNGIANIDTEPPSI